MSKHLHKVAVAAGLALIALANSASAAVAQASSYTYDFKTFYDTSTVLNLFDTKTLNYSVAQLTITDISGGVQLSLKQLSNAFPAKTTAGTFADKLYLNGMWGSGANVSGVTGTVIPSLLPIVQDGGYIYNGLVDYKDMGIGEGLTSTITIKGTGVTAYNFAKSSNIPMLELANVGSPYSTLLSSQVHFIGSLVATPAVPEPGTYGLMGLGLAGLAVAVRARRSA